jgi:hypothetical protein
MGGDKRVRANPSRSEPGEAEIASPARISFLLIIALWSALGAGLCVAQSEVTLTDLWDAPHDLQAICKGQRTLLFVCDLELSTCREGAVYFDSKAGAIESRGIKPAHIFIGNPPEIREAVLAMDLGTAAYIDANKQVFAGLLDKEILPAIVLLDGDGSVIETRYGGGESLDGNIRAVLGEEDGGGRRWWLILIPVAVIAILPFVID